MQILIERAAPEESAELTDIAFRSKANHGYSGDFMEACREELVYSAETLREHPFFVARREGEAAGFYGLEKRGETRFELEAMFIEPRFMRRGVGRRLMEHATNFLASAGARELIIQSDPFAEAFYLAMGAVRIGEKESVSIPGRFLPLLRLDV